MTCSQHQPSTGAREKQYDSTRTITPVPARTTAVCPQVLLHLLGVTHHDRQSMFRRDVEAQLRLSLQHPCPSLYLCSCCCCCRISCHSTIPYVIQESPADDILVCVSPPLWVGSDQGMASIKSQCFPAFGNPLSWKPGGTVLEIEKLKIETSQTRSEERLYMNKSRGASITPARQPRHRGEGRW